MVVYKYVITTGSLVIFIIIIVCVRRLDNWVAPSVPIFGVMPAAGSMSGAQQAQHGLDLLRAVPVAMDLSTRANRVMTDAAMYSRNASREVSYGDGGLVVHRL